MIRTSFASLLGVVLMTTSVSPCGFHNYTPQPTLVDRLLGSDDIVLARPSSENPFRYEPVELLEGRIEYVEIPQLVDSTSRRRFALSSEAKMLFARDSTYGPWQQLAFVDAAFEPVLRTVMDRLSSWEMGDDEDRFSYFASILDHPDQRLHTMALRELDLAGYNLLRELSPTVDSVKLRERIDDPREADLKPIRILLLGLSGDENVASWLRDGLRDSVVAGGQYIGAFATALIELNGAEAVRYIAASYLTDLGVPRYSRELLVEALALHGQAEDLATGAAVSEAIESALWIDPGLAGPVARQFGSRGVWSQMAVLSMTLMQNALDSADDRQDVIQYLTLAAEAQQDH